MRFAMLSNYMKTQVDIGGGRSPSPSKVVSNNTSNPMPYRVVLLCATLSLLLGCILKDDGRLTAIQSELDQNRMKWTSATVSNYQLNFRWICYCSPEYVEPVNISVRENRIVDVAFVKNDVPFTMMGLWRYRTIEGLFDLLQEGIDKKAHAISVEYHPELGYPVKVSIDYEEYTVDEEKGFEIDSLIVERL